MVKKGNCVGLSEERLVLRQCNRFSQICVFVERVGDSWTDWGRGFQRSSEEALDASMKWIDKVAREQGVF